MTTLKAALRTLARTPFVTLVAVVSLALGIGVNTGIYSLFDRLLLRPLPVMAPERLVNLAAPGPKPGSHSCNVAGDCEEVFSYPMFRDLEREQTVFTGVAAHCLFDANLAYRGRTMHAQGVQVSGSYFPVLGLQPALGRLLGPDDDRSVGGQFVVVLSHEYWVAQMAADPAVLDQTLVVNGQPLTIVGVAPGGFEGSSLGARPSVFVPITMRELMLPGWKGLDNRRSYWAYVFARLRPGISIDAARTAMNGPYRAILHDIEVPLQKGMSDATLERFKARELLVSDGRMGQTMVAAKARVPLLILLVTTGIVLLINCANIANLLLARAARRSGEMAVRLAIGASRRHLLTQLITESCLLAVFGGLAGLVVAWWTISLVGSLLPAEQASTLPDGLQPSVLIFAAGLSLGTGALFGIFPAFQSTRPDLISSIKDQAGQPSGGRTAARFRVFLVTAQIALSMALLALAGLFVKSLWNVSRADLGLKLDQVVTFAISPELNGYTPDRSRALFERIENELAALPGVTGVTAAQVPLLAFSNWGNSLAVEGFPTGPDVDRHARFNRIGPGYFRTLRVPLLAGREFSTSDTTGTPKVAIVNEAFAKTFNLGHDVVGRRLGTGENDELDTEIVGFVANAKYSEVKQVVPPVYFQPYRQGDDVGAISFYVRTSLDPGSLLPTIAAVIARLDPDLPVEDPKTMPQQVRENVFIDRMVTTLSVAFALLATVLAAVGLYGVLAYTVTQRTREIGLRMALGADAASVRGLVLRQVARMTAVGGVVGLAAALGLGRLAGSLLFEIQGDDPTVVLTAAVLLAAIAFAAGFGPAYRASRVDPMRALRYE